MMLPTVSFTELKNIRTCFDGYKPLDTPLCGYNRSRTIAQQQLDNIVVMAEWSRMQCTTMLAPVSVNLCALGTWRE